MGQNILIAADPNVSQAAKCPNIPNLYTTSFKEYPSGSCMTSIILSESLLHKEMKTFAENVSFVWWQCNAIFIQVNCDAIAILYFLIIFGKKNKKTVPSTIRINSIGIKLKGEREKF